MWGPLRNEQMARENVLWRWFKHGVKDLRDLDIERVENGVARGTPDVDGCWGSVAFKIELKRVALTKSGVLKVKFQPMQIPWLKRRWRAGGNVWVMLAVGEGHAVARYLVRGCDTACLEDTTIREIEEISVVAPDATPKEMLEAACMKLT